MLAPCFVAQTGSAAARCAALKHKTVNQTQCSQMPQPRLSGWAATSAVESGEAAGVSWLPKSGMSKLLAAAAAALLIMDSAAPALAETAASSSGGNTLSLTFVPHLKSKMDERDESMQFQCVQMFDCDGDRREYAKKQWADLMERGGPERKAKPAAAEPAEVGEAAPRE